LTKLSPKYLINYLGTFKNTGNYITSILNNSLINGNVKYCTAQALKIGYTHIAIQMTTSSDKISNDCYGGYLNKAFLNLKGLGIPFTSSDNYYYGNKDKNTFSVYEISKF